MATGSLILAEGDGAIVANKPSGQLVHNSHFAGPREHTLAMDIRALCGADYHPVHRIDRGASGCVVFARRHRVAHYQAAMALCTKRYLAIVRGTFRRAVDVDHAIDNKEAQTFFAPISHSAIPRVSLVAALPKSGRLHQVRRHLKHLSHPIIGDANYGKGKLNRELRARYGIARLALHLVEIECADLRATAKPPADLHLDALQLRL